MKNTKIRKLILFSFFICTLIMAAKLSSVDADTISAGDGNRIHFINLKSKSGSDAILLESRGHFALIDMGEDYDFPNKHSKDSLSYETELLLYLTIGFYTMAIPLLHFF